MASSKVRGGIIGLLLGGPAGAALGLAAGHLLDNVQYSKERLKYLLSKTDLTEKELNEAVEIFNYRHKNDTTSVDFVLYGAMIYLRVGEYERFLSVLIYKFEMNPQQAEWDYIMREMDEMCISCSLKEVLDVILRHSQNMGKG